MTIIEKMKLFKELENHIDTFIRSKMYSYIKENNILFSDPQGWIIDDDFHEIEIYGQDGCLGCYDPKSIYIPMEYFGLNTKDFVEQNNE